MDIGKLKQEADFRWRIEPAGAMRVPGILYADEALLRGMDDKVFMQLSNVATLPGIVKAAYAMPDAHWGYGFPIGGVAAFDADAGGNRAAQLVRQRRLDGLQALARQARQ